MPNQSDLNKSQSPAPPPMPDIQASDLPPLPGNGNNQSPVNNNQASTTSAGAAALPPETPPVIPPTPKKRFGTGKIIATILGILILSGGIVGGVVLVKQQQDIREKASIAEPCKICQGKKCVKIDDPPNCTHSLNECSSDAGCAPPSPPPPSPPPPARDCGVGDCGNLCEQDGGTCTGKKPNCACTYPPSPTCSKEGESCASGKACCSGLYCITATKKCSKNPPPPECSNSNPCANGYSCQNGTCVPNSSGSCKSGDPGAPVCCTTACQGEIVCEPSARKECKTTGANGTKWCTLEVNSSDCEGGGGGGGTESAQCLNIKAYSTTWSLLTAAQLSQLKAGDQVNFCVAGTTTQGTFDKARFTINGVAQAETTAVRPGSTNEFCQPYTIPAETWSFKVDAQIHHPTLGWR